MISVDVSFNGEKGSISNRVIQQYLKQMPYAISRSMNDMSKSIIDQQPAYMQKVFSNPTRWTLNGAARVPSGGKTDLNTTVLLKDKNTRGGTSVASYTYPDRYGVRRDSKPFEHVLKKTGRLKQNQYLVPAGKFGKKNGKWTIPRAEVNKILAQFEKPGKGTVARSREEGNNWRYFVAVINGTHGMWRTIVPKFTLRDRRYKPGSKTYQKMRDKLRSKRQSIQLVASVRETPPNYKQIFEFKDQVITTGRKEFGGFFRTRLSQAINTRRNK